MIKLPSIKIKTQGGSSLPMILVLLALVAGFVFYFQVIKPGQVNEYELLPSVRAEISKLRTFRVLELDFSVFDRADFKSLRIFGESPVKTAPGGKNDLFSQ
ncbi:MAG: hypothetical protein HYS78_01480 [Parcubacteria group bacterium]|nr:hypothetical protein [Parcubacteria group bacterium]